MASDRKKETRLPLPLNQPTTITSVNLIEAYDRFLEERRRRRSNKVEVPTNGTTDSNNSAKGQGDSNRLCSLHKDDEGNHRQDKSWLYTTRRACQFTRRKGSATAIVGNQQESTHDGVIHVECSQMVGLPQHEVLRGIRWPTDDRGRPFDSISVDIIDAGSGGGGSVAMTDSFLSHFGLSSLTREEEEEEEEDQTRGEDLVSIAVAGNGGRAGCCSFGTVVHMPSSGREDLSTIEIDVIVGKGGLGGPSQIMIGDCASGNKSHSHLIGQDDDDEEVHKEWIGNEGCHGGMSALVVRHKSGPPIVHTNKSLLYEVAGRSDSPTSPRITLSRPSYAREWNIQASNQQVATLSKSSASVKEIHATDKRVGMAASLLSSTAAAATSSETTRRGGGIALLPAYVENFSYDHQVDALRWWAYPNPPTRHSVLSTWSKLDLLSSSATTGNGNQLMNPPESMIASGVLAYGGIGEESRLATTTTKKNALHSCYPFGFGGGGAAVGFRRNHPLAATIGFDGCVIIRPIYKQE